MSDSKLYTEFRLEVLDSNFYKHVPKDLKIEILAEGHQWTEGPLWYSPGGFLLYSDIPRNAIYKWDPKEGSRQYLTPSGFSGENFAGAEPGSNALILNPQGELVLCQHGNRQMARMKTAITQPDADFITLADRYQNKRLNSPNDAVYHSNGELWFTDPPYGLPGQMEDPEKELDFQGVFKLNTENKLELMISKLSRPNGLAFSPDETRFYIANSDPELAIWEVYELDSDGNLGEGRILYDATANTANGKGLPDGMKINSSGIVFATGPGGLYVFDAQDHLLGRILISDATSNCAFNEDQSILFVTADSYVLKLELR